MKNLHHLAIGVGSFRAVKFLSFCQAHYRGKIVFIVGFPMDLVFFKCYFQWWLYP